MQRRRFLRYAAAAPLLSVGGLAGCPDPTSVAPDARRSTSADAQTDQRAVLTEDQWALLDAVCARIIPTDSDPGAREAHVVNYIDGQLAHPPVSGFRRMITIGLRKLEFVSRRLFRGSFTALAPEKQDRALLMLQRAKRFGGRYDGKQLMRVLVTLTIEGFLSDPIYGGNRGGVGWKLIGFRPQAPRPRAPYRGRLIG